LPVRQTPDEPESQWEMQMLVMAIALETMSILRWETAKDSASE